MYFLHQSAVLVKFPYQLAKLSYNDKVPQNVSGLQRVISLYVYPLWVGSGSVPCHLLSRNHADKAASIWTVHSHLSNTVLAMPVVPEK